MQSVSATQFGLGDALKAQQTGVMLLNPAGSILFGNPAAQELLIGSAGHGHTLHDALLDSERHGRLHAGSTATILAAVNNRATIHLRNRDGRTLHLAASGSDSGNTVLEVVDISPIIQHVLSQTLDPLTGLSNRTALLDRLAAHQELGPRDRVVTVLHLHIDRFKAINDDLGHPMGDQVLKLAADRMAKLVGPDDLLVRLGANEFVVLRVGADHADAEDLAQRVVDLVKRPYLVSGNMIYAGASVGGAAATDGITADEVLKHADLALTRAKADGTGTPCFFTGDLHETLAQRRQIETDLRRALALGEFTLAYQPQFEADCSKLVGFEALLRWDHPTRGAISPAEFVPIAEEMGMMPALGEWVLRTACLQAAQWPDHLSIAVNISPLQFRSANIVATVASALANAALTPARLELEITEGALLSDTEQVLTIFNQLRALGLRFAMDDFGTGYSSLSYLQKFPFDKIKIDQSFVRNVAHSQDSAAIVRAISALGASLGMTTVAEGVETQEQLASITSDGCKHVQGYLTGRPLAVDAATQLAQANYKDVLA